MIQTNTLRPSYAGSGAADAILDLFRRQTPKKIDSKFVSDNRIATSSNAFRTVDLVKWLGITDREGNVDEGIAGKLRLIGEERDKFVCELVKKSYKVIFDRFDLLEATKEDIINFFITEYKYGSVQALHAARLFIHLCQKYGIAIADKLKKQTYDPNKKREPREKKIIVKKTTKTNSQEDNFSLEEGEIIIKITGNGLNRTYSAKNSEELQNIYEIDLKKAIDAAKILFPDKKETKEETIE